MTTRLKQRLFSMDMAVRDNGSTELQLALRWRVHPALGLPRQPFKLFRSAKDSVPLRALADGATVSGSRLFTWDWEPQTRLAFSVTRPKAGSKPILFEALDDRGVPIPGVSHGPTNELSFTVNLRHPNICALRAVGDGNVSTILSLPLSQMVVHAAWQLVEQVGLPFAKNELPAAQYDCTANQGSAGQLVDGVSAARRRLGTALGQFVPPPATTPSKSRQAPVWGKPVSADAVLAELKQSPNGPLTLIRQMLVDTAPGTPYERHQAYRHSAAVAGFRQPGDTSGKTPDPATVELDVMGLAMTAVTTDTWSAVALGFGTTVFAQKPPAPPPVPRIAPDRESASRAAVDLAPGAAANAALPDFEYMVTATYTNAFGQTETWAAVAAPVLPLAGFAPGPVAPLPLAADTLRRHRPMTMDGASSEDVRLRWPRLAPKVAPQAYALALCPAGGPAMVLNQPRVAGGFSPYVPMRGGPGDDPKLASYIAGVQPVPFDAPRGDVYLAAATDVFGRWSDWAEVAHTMAPDPLPAPPKLLKTVFELGTPAAGPRAVHATLQIEWTMDWADRSWAGVQLVGGYFPHDKEPPLSAPTGFGSDAAGGSNQAALKFSFNAATGDPQNDGSGSTVIEIKPRAANGQRRYRLTYPFFTLDFAASRQLAFAVWMKANPALDAARFTALSDPSVARANDPLPAATPALEPKIHWTALPDATGVGRARLVFSGSAEALGYTVYEASESALRAAAGHGAPTPGTSLAQRAELLLGTKDVPGIAFSTKAIDAFARVNTALLAKPEAEVALPAAIEGLYAYVITSTTLGQVESARSAVALAAVPRRITPPAPRLSVQLVQGSVRATVTPGAGVPTKTVALHRIHAPALAADPDLMGPAVIDRGTPAWSVSTSPAAFIATDTPTPSWRPYYYRAVAYGDEDPEHGRRAGRSAFSPVAELLLPPSEPPDLAELVVTKAANTALLRVTLRSKADARLSPLGAHRLQVLALDPKRPVPTEVLHAEALLTEIEPIATPPVEALGSIRRGPRDANGRTLYEAYVPAGVGEIRVRLRDPLGRSSALSSMPDLEGLQLAGGVRQVTLTVRSAVPIAAPPSGAFVLTLRNESGTKPVTLVQANLHQIATSGSGGVFVRSGPDAQGRFIYSLTLSAAPGPLALSVTLTEPVGISFNQLRGSVNVLEQGQGEES